MKACKECGAVKPLHDFYAHKRMSDGHLNICKPCFRSAMKENRSKNADHYREYERRRAVLPHRVKARALYATTAKGVAASRRAKSRYRENNPVRRAAHVLTGNAIRRGILTKQPCEICGAEIVYAHHDDYAFPLSVRWLCPAHHSDWHKHNEPANG